MKYFVKIFACSDLHFLVKIFAGQEILLCAERCNYGENNVVGGFVGVRMIFCANAAFC